MIERRNLHEEKTFVSITGADDVPDSLASHRAGRRANSTSNSRIVVTGNNVTINLNAVSMLLDDCNGSPIEIAANKTATIVLSGENQMTAFAAGPGILVNQGATLTIQGSSDAALTV